MASAPLWYAQRVEGRRPEIEIVDDRTRLDEPVFWEVHQVVDDAFAAGQPADLIRSHVGAVDRLGQRCVLQALPSPASNVVHVVRLRDAATVSP